MTVIATAPMLSSELPDHQTAAVFAEPRYGCWDLSAVKEPGKVPTLRPRPGFFFCGHCSTFFTPSHARYRTTRTTVMPASQNQAAARRRVMMRAPTTPTDTPPLFVR